jgi:PKD repeat protein
MWICYETLPKSRSITGMIGVREMPDLLVTNSRIVVVTVVAACATTVACDSAPLLAPTNSTITMTASTRVLPTGGSADLTATVLENSGSAVPDGTTVRFSASLGHIEPEEAQTRNGTARARFIAGHESGMATIRALSGLASGGSSGTGGSSTPANEVQISVGAAAAGAVTLTANPGTVRPSGSSVEVMAFVTDTNGNWLPNVPVVFSTTRGTVTPAVVATDGEGFARTTLTASETATVTATVGSGASGQAGGGSSSRTATLEIRAATVASFTLATSPSEPAVGQPVSLTITPAANTAPRVTVNWGDGSVEDIGVVSAARSVTHAYTTPGFYTISAAGTSPEGDTFSNSIAVTVASAPPVQVTANPTSGSLATSFSFTITPTTGALISAIRINYGDGTEENLGAISTSVTRQHTYSSTGSKTVTVTQTETNGRVTQATVTITVTSS